MDANSWAKSTRAGLDRDFFLSGKRHHRSPSVAGIDGSDVYVYGEVARPFAILTSQGRCGWCG